MRIAALLLLLLLPQDDPRTWLDQLGSDDVRERDAATRRLESLGLEAVERLQAQPGGDLEVRARLRQIAITLKKRAEMAKVFGPTKRVTVNFQKRKLGEVLKELGKALGEEFEGGKIDPEKPVDLELKGATLWEVLEALGRAAGVRCEVGYREILVSPGVRQDLPSKSVEQFRIGIAELKRMERRTPVASDQAGIVTLLVSYQRNMHPVEGWFRDGMVIDSAVDAAGKSVRIDRLEWANSSRIDSHPFSKLETIWVRPDAGPITIEGRTQLRFETDRVEVSVPMEEGKRKTRLGDFAFELDEVVQTAEELSLELQVEGNGIDPKDRLKVESVCVIDGKGTRHDGSTRSAGSAGNTMHRTYTFSGVIEKPDRLVLTWITEFHDVEIPFRFEGVRIP